jgi:hypothetical protein
LAMYGLAVPRPEQADITMKKGSENWRRSMQ